MHHAAPAAETNPDRARIAELEALLAEAQGTIERLRRAYERTLEQLKLLQQRLFVAKAERVDASSEQLAFDVMLAQASRLAKELAAAKAAEITDEQASTSGNAGGNTNDPNKPRKPPGKGRRKLQESELPEVRVEVTDPAFEGKAERIGVEESSRLGYRRGGAVRIVVARIVYKSVERVVDVADHTGSGPKSPPTAPPLKLALLDVRCAPGPRNYSGLEMMYDNTGVNLPVDENVAAAAPDEVCKAGVTGVATRTRFITAPLPKELVRRGLLAPSMISHILVTKYLLGVPFYRLEQQMALQGAPLDRGTM